MRDVVVLVDVDRSIALVLKQFMAVIASIASAFEDLEELVDVTATAIAVVRHHGNAPTTKSATMQDAVVPETIFYKPTRTLCQTCYFITFIYAHNTSHSLNDKVFI